ncbi:DUF2750 domain-containing protein [Vibrio genomosp. F10]|uniref:DUF2750 domain-containing protein n=2 Tax=Vibrio genomosp. F10 TaxID=723171 RepID=A0A1E5B9P2_9VIBR|nr:DUF2750 domain-containing protein [Vibrio genomosp. F10]OEE30635.1 hypothetical protein A1QO_14995 [Vibrio genomosp. F10 str. ZF-129]OEE87872.1 hypothetical protein A1QK_19235 [Vibrio genomosp. F10 str. 9ZD137]OEE96648.1 hypothetical protein A1QM_16615 [Vibrio genomosp. F10 str. 9ZC157]OEF09636.1 hypothetical protein A1QI_13745 [Vibrio genomosp. F10 str. 9ZB36]
MTKLTADIQANLELFVTETCQNKLVWGLRNEEGWLACDSSEFEQSEVMPFWSSKEDAEHHNVEEWSDFEILEIPLDIFVEDWLLTLAEDGVLIGTNWNESLEGKEIEPSDLAKLYLEKVVN